MVCGMLQNASEEHVLGRRRRINEEIMEESLQKIFQVEYWLKAYIRPSLLESALKYLSNSMWKFVNGLLDQELFSVNV